MVRTAVAAGAVVVGLGLGLGTLGVTGGVTGAARPEVGAARSPGAVVAGRASDAAGAGVGDLAGRGTVSSTGADGAPGGAAAAAARTFVVPLDPPVAVARPFDAPPQPWAAGHRGVDLSAHPGQVVRAPQGGVVSFAGTVVDRGVVTVTHPDGLRSSLEPVDPSVRAGQRVLQGQAVGTVGAVDGHCAPATCLHWGLRRGDAYLDPLRWVLDRGPIVLLPTG